MIISSTRYDNIIFNQEIDMYAFALLLVLSQIVLVGSAISTSMLVKCSV